jgi:hypothetical protein
MKDEWRRRWVCCLDLRLNKFVHTNSCEKKYREKLFQDFVYTIQEREKFSSFRKNVESCLPTNTNINIDISGKSSFFIFSSFKCYFNACCSCIWDIDKINNNGASMDALMDENLMNGNSKFCKIIEISSISIEFLNKFDI